tara:strand:+ start:324 stop:479 length:156 start_codon:yes stop_codon:yes gene_type:complete
LLTKKKDGVIAIAKKDKARKTVKDISLLIIESKRIGPKTNVSVKNNMPDSG